MGDQRPSRIGRRSGWGADDEDSRPGEQERMVGPSMMPFLRYRPSDRWWRLGLVFLWLPAMIVVITVEDWLHLPQSVGWISLGVLFVVFMAYVLLRD